MTIEKKYVTTIADLHYKNEVMYVTFNGAIITLPAAKEFIHVLNTEFAEQLPVQILADIAKLKTPEKAARDYWATKEAEQVIKSLAILAKSILAKIAGNLFLSINRPSVPTKMFTDEVAALGWLAQIKQHEKITK
jgi:hypothetical protein